MNKQLQAQLEKKLAHAINQELEAATPHRTLFMLNVGKSRSGKANQVSLLYFSKGCIKSLAGFATRGYPGNDPENGPLQSSDMGKVLGCQLTLFEGGDRQLIWPIGSGTIESALNEFLARHGFEPVWIIKEVI